MTDTEQIGTPQPDDPTRAVTPGGNLTPQSPVLQSGPSAGGRADETVVLRRDSRTPTLAWLVEVSGTSEGQLHRIRGHFTIGRDADRTLVINEGSVSRIHAEVVVITDGDDQPQFTLRDMGSADGTLVNGETTTDVRLQDGDEIRIGGTTFVFRTV